MDYKKVLFWVAVFSWFVALPFIIAGFFLSFFA